MNEAEYLGELQRQLLASHLRFIVCFEIGGSTPKADLRPLISVLPNGWQLWFYDRDHPSGSDPGAIIELERKGGTHRVRSMNHGWTGFWRETSETSVVEYLFRCRKYNSDIRSHLNYLILWKNAQKRSRDAPRYLAALFGLLLKEPKRSFRVEFQGHADTARDDLAYLLENLPAGWGLSFFDRRYQWDGGDEPGAVAEVRQTGQGLTVRHSELRVQSDVRPTTPEEITDQMWDNRIYNGQFTYQHCFEVFRRLKGDGAEVTRVRQL